MTTAGNIPGLFSIIQGTKARPRLPMPMTHVMPDGSTMSGPPMTNIPGVPGHDDGGLQMLASAGLDSPEKVQMALAASRASAAQPAQRAQSSSLGSAIDKYTQSPLANHAMRLASYLEGGNGPDATTWGTGDNGLAHGAFQVRADAHPTYDVNRANDADYNANFMSNDYNLAAERVNRENPGLSESDPARAAALAAFYAERPTNMYAENIYRDMYKRAVAGRAGGGDVQLPDMYQSMTPGPMDAAPAPAPAGGAPMMSMTDPLAPVLMQIAQQYNLIDVNGQPDLEAARKIYEQNPTLFAGGGDQTGQSPLPGPNIPGIDGGVPMRMHGGDVSVAGYDFGTPTPTVAPGPGQPGSPYSMPGGGPGAGNTPVYSVTTTQSPPPVTATDAWGPSGDIKTYMASQAAGGGGGNHVGTTDDFYINQLVGMGDITSFQDAKDLWDSMSPGDKAAWKAKVGKDSFGGGAGSDAATYAAIAQRREEAANLLAFQKADAEQKAAADREKAMQDFYTNREILKTQRGQLQAQRANDALSQWNAAVGHANIPGIGNYSLAGGQAAEQAVAGARPILNYNPLEAMGASPAWTDNPAPNIPGIDWGQAA